MQAYCVKCREKREIANPEAVFTSTGTPGTRGSCPECGTTIFRMGNTEAHEGLPKPEIVKKPKKAKAIKKKKKASSKKRARRKSGKLVIVESPAKARTVGNFLGKGYTVKASKGHVRDLLKSQISVDVENDFEPKYRVPNDKRQTVKELKKDVESAAEIFLATDPDREGEAIAWHLMQATDIEPERLKRVVFHEITDSAVDHAFAHPREINMDLVNAQQARRILDRLVGYKLTPLLWDRVRNQLSAGRVQSISLRMVVDREREIEAFNPVEYWSVEAELAKQSANGKKARNFTARLVKINGEDAELGSEGEVMPHVEVLEKSQYQVDTVKRGTRRRRPSAPFTTSSLQQEASRRLGFSAKKTMSLAQKLYEGIDVGGTEGTVGLITYMRTDSTNVSEQAVAEARDYVTGRFGKEYIPEKPPQYTKKAKGAQEAHEAVRPTSVQRDPKAMQQPLTDNARNAGEGRDLNRLYQLIWERFVASQMSSAVYNTLRVEIKAGLTLDNAPYLLRVSGSTIKFRGFLALYEDTRDEDSSADPDEGRILPELTEEELLDLIRVLPEQHFTQPPPRYTEASLVRTLEENGIGRPSTYAQILGVIQDRDYVKREDKRLTPTEIGKTVNDLLVEYFPEVLDYQFTARMEDQLDEVSEGDVDWIPMLHEFYGPFKEHLDNAQANMPMMRQVEYIGQTCPTCETGDLIVKYGRWGKFVGCSNYPECEHTEPYLEYIGVSCPTCGDTDGGQVVERKTRRGRTFWGCSRYPDCDYSSWTKPGGEQQTEQESVASLDEAG